MMIQRVDNFDFSFNPKTNCSLVFDLATGAFIQKPEDGLFLGPGGRDKSHHAPLPTFSTLLTSNLLCGAPHKRFRTGASYWAMLQPSAPCSTVCSTTATCSSAGHGAGGLKTATVTDSGR